MEIGYHFGPVPALDFSSICEHLPFLPQNTFEISAFQGHFHYMKPLRAPPGVLGINEVLANDLILKVCLQMRLRLKSIPLLDGPGLAGFLICRALKAFCSLSI